MPGKDTIRRDLEQFLQEKVVPSNRFYRKREKIVTEIFASERRYQEQLRVIVDVFMTPLRSRGIIPDGVFKTIFGDLTAIQAVNKELLAHMEETSIGTAFLQLAPYLRLYCTYANNFDKAMITLQEWERKMADFSRFLREQEGKEDCRSLSLHAFLITPVQRVPRYKLLLEQLLDHTPPSNEDYMKIKEAAQMMGDVTMGINEYIREHENFEKMLNIQQRLTGANAPRILVPGRRFIREGTLMKVSRKGFGSHERMFFLFSDILVYAKPILTIERPLAARTFACREVIPLQECNVQLILGETKAADSGAVFKLIYGANSLLLYSSNNQDAHGWIKDIKGAIGTLVDNEASLRRTSSVALEALAQTLPPNSSLTPYRYALRPRNRTKIFENVVNTPGSQPDSLYPLRSQVTQADSKDSVEENSTKVTSLTPKAKKTPGSKRRPRRDRSYSPFARKKGRKSDRCKRKRLERGPLPLKREQNVENTPSVYHDALSDLPDADQTGDFTFHTILEENISTFARNHPRRRSYKSYEDSEEIPDSLGSSMAEASSSSCIIL